MGPFSVLVLIFLACFTDSSSEGLENSQSKTSQPYIDTEAEKWAFEQQMKVTLKHAEEKIRERARSFILRVELDKAKLPDRNLPVAAQEQDQDFLSTLAIRDGVLTGLKGIRFVFEKILAYEGPDVVFSGEIKYPGGLQAIHSFFVISNGTIVGRGNTTGFVEELNFHIKCRLNLKTGTIQVDDFDRNCRSHVKVDFEGRGLLDLQLVQSITRATKHVITTYVLKDVEKLTMTAAEGALENIEGKMELPHYDYDRNYAEFEYVGQRFRPNVTRCSKYLKEPVLMRATIRTSGVGINYPDNLPFIQNDPEMKSFFDQLRNGTHRYLDDVLEKTVNTLKHRGISPAKLPEMERTFVAGGDSNGSLIGSLNFTDGWVSGIYDISRIGMDFVYIDKTKMEISARFHLHKDLEVREAYALDLESYKDAGRLRGTTDNMIFMIKILVDLKTFETTLLDLYLVCIGDVKFLLTETRGSSYDVGIIKAAVDSFNRTISNEIGKLIRHALAYAISKIRVGGYLPPWDYSRVCDRKGNLEPKYRMCEKADLDKAMQKKHESMHQATVKLNQVHFINTELELQSYGAQLVLSMNKYLKEMLHEASKIITLQDLKKIRYKYYVRPWNAKDPDGMYHFGTISIFGGVLEDLSILFQGQDLIDDLEVDDTSIVVTARIPLWWSLKFQANASVIQGIKSVGTQLKGELTSLIYYLRIRVDYPNKVTIEDFHVECLGDGKFWTKFSYNDNWMRESFMEHFNGFLAQRIWPEANQILKRSLEDAINANNVSAYLPEKDYGAGTNGHPLRRIMPWDDLRNCHDTIETHPALDHSKVKVVDFKEIFPRVVTKTLRMNLDKQIKKEYIWYLNGLWISTKERVSKELAHGHPPPKRISFYPEGLGGEQEAVLQLNDGWFKVFSRPPTVSHPYLVDLETAYGENSSFITLLTEDLEVFKVAYNFTLEIPGEHIHGSILLMAEGIRNIVRTRFFMNTNQMVIEDYDILCTNQTIASITGLPSDYNGLKTAISQEAIRASLLPLYQDYMVEMMDAFDAVVKTDEVTPSLLPDYFVNKHLFGIAARQYSDPGRQEKRKEIAVKCNMEEEPGFLDVREHPRFIGTEAEWSYFKKQINTKLDSLKQELEFSALTYLVVNELHKMSLPDVSGEVDVKDLDEVKVPMKYFARNGTMFFLFEALSSPEKIYFDNVTNEVILQAYLTSEKVIEFHYEVKVNDEVGEIDGSVERVVFSFRVHVHLGKKHLRLERMQLKCIRGIKMEFKGLSHVQPGIKEKLSDSIEKVLMTSALDDMETIATIALLNTVMKENENFNLPAWNYDKDYSTIPSSGDEEDFNICPTKSSFFKGPDGLIYYSE